MNYRLSRRAVLTGIGAVACDAMLRPSVAARPRGWIDVHHHFIPPEYRDFFAQARNRDGTPATLPPTDWNLAADLEDMERGGTATAMLSMFVPPVLGTAEMRARLARSINEYAARLAADHPGRFGSFAALPLPDVDGSLRELSYAADTLKADGFCVYTNVGDRWLGDPQFESLFAELNHRKAVLFVHPVTAACCHNLLPGVPDNIIEYQTDTTRAIASLVFGGVTSRYPDIRFIFSHGGGTMPYLVERFLGGTAAELVPGIVTSGQGGPYVPKQPPLGVMHELRRLHYDTAQCANPIAMQALKRLVPVSQILYGTDYFYRTAAETSAALRQCAVFRSTELDAIGFQNGDRLWPVVAAAANTRDLH